MSVAPIDWLILSCLFLASLALALKLKKGARLEEFQARVLEIHTDALPHVVPIRPQVVAAPVTVRCKMLKRQPTLPLSVHL
jgi:hypothetical protein